MKHFFHRNLFLTAAAFAGATASAQAQATPKPPPAPPTTDTVYRTAIAAMGEPVVAYQSEPALQKKIKLDIKDKTSAEIFKKLAEQAEVELVVDPGAMSDRKYTIKADSATIQSAMNGLANFEGVRWRYQNLNGKKQIRISRGTVPGSAYQLFTTEGNAYANQIDSAVQNRLRIAERALTNSRSLTYMFSATLPDTRVKIDMRDADVRDVLKDILTQANLPYALEDDVPTGQKRSFTFENVPISMALDIITTSIGIGWSAERQPAPKTGASASSGSTTAMPLVRVGKKYTGRTQLFRSFLPATTVNVTTTTNTDQPAPSTPTPPPTATP